jgi:hypothetical protein
MDDLQEWPQYATGPRESLFAIGVASSNFAALESVLHFMFGTLFDLGQDDYSMIASKIGTEAALILMRQKLDFLDWPQDTKDRIQHFLKGFEICLANRNHLVHSEISWLMGTHETEKTFLFKRTKKGELQMAAPRLPQLREIADTMHVYAQYGRGLGNWINNHRTEPPTFPDAAFPLPDKPASPAILGYSSDPQPL